MTAHPLWLGGWGCVGPVGPLMCVLHPSRGLACPMADNKSWPHDIRKLSGARSPISSLPSSVPYSTRGPESRLLSRGAAGEGGPSQGQ